MASTPNGQRNRRIAFERGATSRGGLGSEPAPSWSTLCGAWAAVRYGSGQERRQAAGDSATMTATFRVLSTPSTRGVTERDRIQFGGAWDIASIAPIGVNHEIEFTATAARG